MRKKIKPKPGDWVKLPDVILQFSEGDFTPSDLHGIVISRKEAKDSFDFAKNFFYVLTPTNRMVECLETNLEVVFR